MQADRLLNDMHKVCCHDLPNQIVIVQTLLQLLVEDEAERLSETGLEYLRRTQRAMADATEMARFLREMARLAQNDVVREPIAFAMLARDWRDRLLLRFPDRSFSLEADWGVASAVGDARLLSRAVLEAVALLLPTGPGGVVVRMRSERRDAGVALDVRVIGGKSPKMAAPEKSLEYILIRSWLAAGGAILETLDTARFAILLPG